MKKQKYRINWGNILKLVTAVAVLWLVFVGLGNVCKYLRAEQVELPPVERMIVYSGDTLWSIALEIAPDKDPREVVFLIRKLNQPTDLTIIYHGQTILVPVFEEGQK